MKLILLSAVVLSLAIDTECGLIIDLFGKVKNTTNDIKDDVKGLFSSGKNLLFGNHNHEEAKGTEKIPDCNNNEEKNGQGIIPGLYKKVHDKVDHLKQNIHNMFTGNAGNHNEVENTTKINNVGGASDKIDFQNNKTSVEKPTNPIQNPINNTSVDSDENFNFSIDVRDAFSKGNNTVQNVNNNLNETVNNVKNSLRDTEQEAVRNVKYIQDKEQEFLTKFSNNVKSEVKKQETSFMDDMKKQL